MKRLIFSGLLALAAASCGSSDNMSDVKKHFCGGAAATANTSSSIAKSCVGSHWNKLTVAFGGQTGDVPKDATAGVSKSECEAAVAKISLQATGTTAGTAATLITKWTDAQRKAFIELGDSKFDTEGHATAACAKIGVSHSES